MLRLMLLRALEKDKKHMQYATIHTIDGRSLVNPFEYLRNIVPNNSPIIAMVKKIYSILIPSVHNLIYFELSCISFVIVTVFHLSYNKDLINQNNKYLKYSMKYNSWDKIIYGKLIIAR